MTSQITWKREEKNSRNESQNSSWDRYWGRFAQLLAQLRSQVLSRSVGTGGKKSGNDVVIGQMRQSQKSLRNLTRFGFLLVFSWLWKSPKSNLLSEEKTKPLVDIEITTCTKRSIPKYWCHKRKHGMLKNKRRWIVADAVSFSVFMDPWRNPTTHVKISSLSPLM